MHVHVFYKALSFSRSVSTLLLGDADVPSCSFKSLSAFWLFVFGPWPFVRCFTEHHEMYFK